MKLPVKFQNDYSRVTRSNDDKVFAKGDYVARADVRGEIIAISNDAWDVLVRTEKGNREAAVDGKLRHVQRDAPPSGKSKPEKPAAKPEKPAAQSPTPNAEDDDCRAEIEANKREINKLRRDIEKCKENRKSKRGTVLTFVPPSEPLVASAPEVQVEQKKEEITQKVEAAITAAEAGDSKGAQKIAKEIAVNVQQTIQNAGRETVNISANCRVEKYKLSGRDTIRIYFDEPPSAEAKREMQKAGFRYYAGAGEKYWGAYFSDKKMDFAEDFCGGAAFNPDEPEADELPEEEPTQLPDDEDDDMDLSEMSTAELGRMILKNL
jgi:hypothetical protein